MDGIFISYRRDDSAGYAGRLYDRLATHFGADQVFMDVEGIDPGTDFVEAIETAVLSCKVLIVLIGDDWERITDERGRRRLEDPNDFIRIETSTALKRNIRVVPVLLDGAPMPHIEELPEDLAPLCRRQAVEIRHKQWDATTGKLIETLDQILLSDGVNQAPAGGLKKKAGADSTGSGSGKLLLAGTAGLFLASVVAWLVFQTVPQQAPDAGLTVVDPGVSNQAPAAAEESDRQPGATAGPDDQANAPLVTTTEPAAKAGDKESAPAPTPRVVATNSEQPVVSPETSTALTASGQPAAAIDAGRIRAPEAETALEQTPLVASAPSEQPAVPPETSTAVAAPGQPAADIDKAPMQKPETETAGQQASEWVAAKSKQPKRSTETSTTESSSGRPAPGMAIGKAPAGVDIVSERKQQPARTSVKPPEPKPRSKPKSKPKPPPQVKPEPDKPAAAIVAGGPVSRAKSKTPPDPPVAAAINPELPQVGERWVYRMRGRWGNSPRRTVEVKLTQTDQASVMESIAVTEGSASGLTEQRRVTGADARVVSSRALGSEFSPYLKAFGSLGADSNWADIPTPDDHQFWTDWRSQGEIDGMENVQVPAGKFNAYLVEIGSSRSPTGSHTENYTEPVRVRYRIWYAPGVKRYVKMVRSVVARIGQTIDTDTVELLSYRQR